MFPNIESVTFCKMLQGGWDIIKWGSFLFPINFKILKILEKYNNNWNIPVQVSFHGVTWKIKMLYRRHFFQNFLKIDTVLYPGPQQTIQHFLTVHVSTSSIDFNSYWAKATLPEEPLDTCLQDVHRVQQHSRSIAGLSNSQRF